MTQSQGREIWFTNNFQTSLGPSPTLKHTHTYSSKFYIAVLYELQCILVVQHKNRHTTTHWQVLNRSLLTLFLFSHTHCDLSKNVHPVAVGLGLEEERCEQWCSLNQEVRAARRMKLPAFTYPVGTYTIANVRIKQYSETHIRCSCQQSERQPIQCSV